MAAFCRLPAERLLCSVCRSVFTDPVSTPCGHNFCSGCVGGAAEVDAPFRCPACGAMFYPGPELKVNALLAQLCRSAVCLRGPKKPLLLLLVFFFFLCFYFEIREEFLRTEASEAGVRQQIQEIRRSIQQMKGQARLSEEGCWALGSAEEELRQFEENPVCGLTEDQPERFSAALLEETIAQVMRREAPKVLIRAELMRARRFAADITLDPQTAHLGLVLSADGKRVWCCESDRFVPQNPARFCHYRLVFAQQSLQSGKFYFQVRVSGKSEWTVGVAKETADPRSSRVPSPSSGFWSVGLRARRQLWALSDPPAALVLDPVPEQVGVFVDRGDGLVLFYDVEAGVLIHSFSGCIFTDRLRPFFGPGPNWDDQNSAPLIITSPEP